MLGAARIRCIQTSYRLFPSIARLLTVPPNVALRPLVGNCLYNGILCELIAYNGNIKEKPAPSKSQQTAVQASGKGQNLSEWCIYALLLLREKRVVLSPMLEWKAVCGKQQPTEGCRLRLVSKRLLWLILPVTGVFATFCATKSWERKTWLQYKWTIKVEKNRRI